MSELKKILEDRLDVMEDFEKSVEYFRENNVKLRNKDHQDLVNRKGPLYDFILSISRKQKIKKIINKK